MAVARRAVDRHAGRLELGAGRVDVVDAIGEMTEIAAAGIDLRVPIVGELDQRRLILFRPLDIAGGGEEDERVAALLVVHAPRLDEAQELEKRDRRLEVGHADHRVQVFHGAPHQVCFVAGFGA